MSVSVGPSWATSTDSSVDTARFFGAVRQKLSRKGSGDSRTSACSTTRSFGSRSSRQLGDSPVLGCSNAALQPQWSRLAMHSGPISPIAAAQSTTADGSQNNSNPYGRTAPPTRRPGALPAELPPAYSPPDANSNAATSPITHTKDSKYAFLASFDTVFLIDDSGSMAGASWRAVEKALGSIAPVCTEHDADGVDVHFLNAPDMPQYRNVGSARAVDRIFAAVRPTGGTPTGVRLHHLLKPYLERYEAAPTTTKPLNVIVITDGAASDDVESVIVRAARRLDHLDAPAWQVGVQFFQVGNEPEAAEALRELDDGLEATAGIRDIVDTVPWKEGQSLDGDRLLKVVLGSVNRRLDRRRNSGESGR